MIDAIDGAALDGPHRRRARRSKVRGPKDTAVTLRSSEGRGAVRHRDRARRHRPARGRDARTSPTAPSATSSSPASPTARRTQFDAAVAAAVERGQKQILVDLRGNPGGYVTAARDDRQPVPRRRHDLLGGGRHGQPRRRRSRARRRRDRPVDPASPCSSTAARRPRPRSSPGALHDRGRATLVGQQDLRQGHGPAVDAARGRQRRVPADDREVADARQDLGPRRGISPTSWSTRTAAAPGDDPVIDAALKVARDAQTARRR